MDVIKKIKDLRAQLNYKAFDAVDLTPDVRSKLTTSKLPLYPMWYFSPIIGIPRTSNIAEQREFAKSVWVQMVTNAIIKAVIQTPWDIIVDDEEKDEETLKEQINYVKSFLDHPNREATQDYSYLISMMMPDVLECNSGVLFLNGEEKDHLLEIIPYDGSTFLKQQDEAGFIKMWYQFSYRNPMASPKPFKPHQIAYFQERHLTYNPYGYSRLEGIQQVVELLDQATRFNKEFFLHDAIPALIANLVGADPDGLAKFKSEFLGAHEGRNSRFAAVNLPDVQFHTLNTSLRDMEWLDGQKWYMHLVFAAYGVSPTEVGFTDSTGSKNVQEGQVQLTIKNAHVPYLHIIEGVMNRQIIPWILNEQKLSPQDRSPLKLKYFVKDPALESAEAQAQRDDVQAKILSINEVRQERGLPPFKAPEADDPFLMNQLMQDASGGFGNAPGKQQTQKDDQQRRGAGGKKSDGSTDGGDDQEGTTAKNAVSAATFIPDIKKKDDYVPLEKSIELVEVTNETYDEFFNKMMDHWEGQVHRAINAKLFKGVDRAAFFKDFSMFLGAIGVGAALLPFVTLLARSVKNTYDKGVSDAEEQLDMNIPVALDFAKSIHRDVNQQIDGYILPNGKKWPGIKGFTQKMQNEILQEVQSGMNQGLGKEEIAFNVSKIFSTMRKGQANAIVASESVRLQNAGRLAAYKASGVHVKKQSICFPDAEDPEVCPSGVCEFLNGQVKELDEPFVGPDGTPYQHPTYHTHCRCFVRAVRA